jgi:hypothetical protein
LLSLLSFQKMNRVGGVVIQEGSGGLGLVATQTIPAGSVITTVPTKVALTVETPSGGPDDSGVADLCTDRKVFRDLPWYAQFSLYLYKLDSVSSTKAAQGINLQSWLDSLPRTFDTPIHWSKEDVDRWLQYPHLAEAVARQTVDWKKLFSSLQSCTSSAVTPMTWDDFVWGCECARSRAFSGAYTGSPFNPLVYAFTLLLVTAYVGLNLGSLEQAANGAALVVCASILRDFVLPKLFKTKKYVICPIIDMCNHKSVGSTAQVAYEFFGDAYSLATESGVTIQPGAEVYISYGSRSNDQLLQFYGFVEPDNPHDVYVMPPLREWDIGALEAACGGPFAPGRLGKLERAGLLGRSAEAAAAAAKDAKAVDDGDLTSSAGNPRGGVVLTRAGGGIDPAVVQALRALVSTEQEWQEAGEAVGNFAAEINAENERKAKLAARTAMEMELGAKATTLQEDRELLQRMEKMSSSEPEEKLAVQFRIEKKKLLQECIDRLR